MMFLWNMLNRTVFVYLNDILIFSSDIHSYIKTVKKFLQRLLENQLFVKAERCDFHCSSVSFLGYVISESQMQMDLGKVQAVLDWPLITCTAFPRLC